MADQGAVGPLLAAAEGGSFPAGVAGSRMAVSAVVSWAASRSAAVVVAGADLGGAVVGTFEAGGTVLAMVVAVPSGATGGGLTVDRPPPEHAATSKASGQQGNESLDTAMIAVAGLLLPVIGCEWTRDPRDAGHNQDPSDLGGHSPDGLQVHAPRVPKAPTDQSHPPWRARRRAERSKVTASLDQTEAVDLPSRGLVARDSQRSGAWDERPTGRRSPNAP